VSLFLVRSLFPAIPVFRYPGIPLPFQLAAFLPQRSHTLSPLTCLALPALPLPVPTSVHVLMPRCFLVFMLWLSVCAEGCVCIACMYVCPRPNVFPRNQSVAN